jgi:predicted nuclease of predicted toxin-antitoxin system
LSNSICSRALIVNIREFAKAEDFVIVSTDSDFYELATTSGHLSK